MNMTTFTDYVYIADFTETDRDILLEYLWHNSTTLGQSWPEPFNLEVAKQTIKETNGIAYNICGRSINLRLYDIDMIDPYKYDNNNGVGTVAELVFLVRQEKNNKTTTPDTLVDILTTTHMSD